MSNIEKESTEENSAKDNLDPLPKEINDEANGQTVTDESNPEQVQLADLQEVERRYQAVFEAAPIGIAIANPAGYFLEANDAFIRMLGYRSEELTRMGVQDIHSQEDLPHVMDEFKTMAQGEKGLAENIPCLCKDGTKIFANINSTIMQIDGIECKVGFFQNISDRLKAEDALRQSEEKYRSILEGIEEGYFEVHLAGNFTFFNEAMHKILGFTPEELLRTNNREYTSKEAARKIFRVFNRVYHTGRPARVSNYEITAKDGSKKILDVSASLLRNSDHNPIGFRGLAHDVTEHLVVEKEKERMAAQIQQAQKMEAIGTLAG